VRWKKVEMAYSDRKVLSGAVIMMVLVSVVGMVLGGPPFLLPWGLASIFVFAARLKLCQAFTRRNPADTPELWANRFAYGAWALGCLWGSTAFVINPSTDIFVQMIMLTVQSALVIGAAVRNNSVPKAIDGQICIACLPVVVACLLTGKLQYQLYSIFVLLHFIFTRAVANVLCRRTERLLLTEAAMQEANDNLAKANERLASLAATDGLTGITNRRGFDQALDREWHRAKRGSGTVSLVIFDIDYFKRLNDSCGHTVGDDYLRQVAACLRANASRPADLVARYGGEEFVVLLADTDHYGAALAAERLRASVETMSLLHPDSPFGIVTLSGGVVTMHADDADPSYILREADRALYEAKSGGRNRIRIFSYTAGQASGVAPLEDTPGMRTALTV
jgi:diguanylate cyclase (GGDEF)-like protein